jgi:hypothetical protein
MSSNTCLLIYSRWASLFEWGSESVRRGMINYAKVKLSCGNVNSEEAKIAALSIRVILDFDIAREIAKAFEDKLVERNMRVSFAVPNHRDFMLSGTPSEATLAEAAARILNEQEEDLSVLAPDLLGQMLDRGLLARGERGEMIGRLFWTIAHDVVIHQRTLNQALHSGDPIYHRPILLLDWLKAMINPHWHSIVLGATPIADPEGMTLEEAFQGVSINFSHFTRAGDYDIIGPQFLWICLVRGMAYQCPDKQRSIDLIAPTHHGNLDSPISPENSGFLFGQVKNSASSSEVLVNPHIGGTPLNLHPSLSLVHDLGLSQARVYPHPTLPAKQLRNPSARKENIHLRHYQIHIEGCTHETYGVVPPEMNNLYKSILGAVKVCDDYPRKDKKDYWDALVRLKPAFFANEPSSLSWIRADFLTKPPSPTLINDIGSSSQKNAATGDFMKTEIVGEGIGGDRVSEVAFGEP